MIGAVSPADPPWDKVTTQQLLEASGLNSYAAFHKYVSLGVLMEPVAYVGRGYRQGNYLTWPRGALERVRWFAKMRARGMKSKDLLAILELRACDPPPKKRSKQRG
jgi:hypothetical protein